MLAYVLNKTVMSSAFSVLKCGVNTMGAFIYIHKQNTTIVYAAIYERFSQVPSQLQMQWNFAKE